MVRFTLLFAMFVCVLSWSTHTLAQKTNNNAVYFDLNKPTLNADARHTLDGMLAGHKINNAQKLLLYGYADYLGTRAHNDSLSTDRAMNVRAYLISKGIPAGNITICVGKGAVERAPVAGQRGYAKDRKVEIITDEARMKALTCQPMTAYEPLNWSKNVAKLNVHAHAGAAVQRTSDEAVALSLPNGDKYIGEIKDGLKVSGGTYIWANGDRYTGDFKDDKREGHGVYQWANGDAVDGKWQQNEIEVGKLTIPYDGVLYQADATHSHSALTYQGALQYTGEFQGHMLAGHGMAEWPNGDRYQGLWANDKMNGHGIYFWPTGERWDGNWQDNKMHGEGKMYNAAGFVTQAGTWVNDVFKK